MQIIQLAINPNSIHHNPIIKIITNQRPILYLYSLSYPQIVKSSF
jgi:hypothetical protein